MHQVAFGYNGHEIFSRPKTILDNLNILCLGLFKIFTF